MFAVKGSRYITHLRKLSGGDQAMCNFLASGVLALGPKLGPFLWQLPPVLPYREDRMIEFFSSLPATAEQAAVLAQRCKRVRTRFGQEPVLTVERPEASIRHAIEVRHDSFATGACTALCR